MTIEEAIDYLMPIYENAQLNRYKAALGTVLAAARTQQAANNGQTLCHRPPERRERATMSEKDCYMCRYFRELKEPWTRADGATIYGYCFKSKLNMEKGFAVFLPDGTCREFSRKKEVQHDDRRSDQDFF